MFLGMEIDSQEEEVWLPADKLQTFKESLHTWQGKKVCKKWDLLLLIG